jgi:hypothetical protein
MKKTWLWCSLGVLSLVGTAWSQDKHPDNASDQVTSVENAIVLQVQKADKQSKIFTKENFPALATVALGLIGTLLSVSAAWAKDLNATAKRLRVLEDAMKRAQFWDTWSKALATVDPESNTEDLRARVKAEILAAADSVQVAFRKPPAKVSPGTPPAQVSSLSRFRRWFLLYKPSRPRAWVPRIFFYYYVLSIPIRPMVTTHTVLFAVVYNLIVAFFFRWLSIWADKPSVVQAH